MSTGARLQAPLLPPRPHRRGDLGAVRPLDDTLRTAIEAALRHTQGKIYGEGGAAEALGLKPGTLQSKMRKLGIDRRLFVG